MGNIKTFFNSFKYNTSNNIDYVPDVTALSAKEWNAVSPEVKKILMDSDKNMPEFAKKVLDYLKAKSSSVAKRIDSLRTNKARINKTQNRINSEVNDNKIRKSIEVEHTGIDKE